MSRWDGAREWVATGIPWDDAAKACAYTLNLSSAG